MINKEIASGFPRPPQRPVEGFPKTINPSTGERVRTKKGIVTKAGAKRLGLERGRVVLYENKDEANEISPKVYDLTTGKPIGGLASLSGSDKAIQSF